MVGHDSGKVFINELKDDFSNVCLHVPTAKWWVEPCAFPWPVFFFFFFFCFPFCFHFENAALFTVIPFIHTTPVEFVTKKRRLELIHLKTPAKCFLVSLWTDKNGAFRKSYRHYSHDLISARSLLKPQILPKWRTMR